MAIRPLLVFLPVALAMSLAACDNRDYEAEIADLQAQLSDAKVQLETLRNENQNLSSEMDDLRTQAEQAAAAAGKLGDDAADAVRNQLSSALDKASRTVDRLAALEREPGAPADARTEAVGVLKNDVQEVVDSVQAAATSLGLELHSGVEPAAGPASEPTAPAAGSEAGQSAPAPEQPAGEQTKPQPQQ
jgi:chromosome segregation ATPase